MLVRQLGALSLVVVFTFAGAACGPNQEANPPYVRDGGPDFSSFGLPCPDPLPDEDGDALSDHAEGADESPPRDTDKDGIPDFRDADSDDDGIPDYVEGRNGNTCTPAADSDHDGVPDFRDLDSDDALNSTLPDRVEAGPAPTSPLDTDGDGEPDYMDPDDDGDGIPDVIEMAAQGAMNPTQDPTQAPDTDGDGTPDYLDLDSDNDTISDKEERFSDVDGDLIPDYRDPDADGDCVADRFESGDTSLVTAAVDTDGDGAPDFADVDSDNDGLIDGKEDKNCSGTQEACETSRVIVDSDGDGVSDLVEFVACDSKPADVQAQTMCACDGRDPNTRPETRGDFVFVVDYMKTPTPDRNVLSLANDVRQADVLFTVDTTTAMQACIDNLGQGLSALIAQVKAKVPDSAFGVFEFRDLGSPQDTGSPSFPSFRYAQRVQTVNGSAGLAAVMNALALVVRGGGDAPEGGWSALWTLATQMTRTITVLPGLTFPLVTNPAGLTVTSGESGGSIGGAGFRAGSVPVIVTVTDANWHDAPGSLNAADAESGIDAYPSTNGGGSPACDPCTNVPSRREAITALQAIGARVIGLAASGSSSSGDPKTRALKLALETGAIVGPGDFGAVGTRPAGCPVDKCCTGLDASGNVVGENPVAGQCPLAFSVNGDNGAGVSSSIAAGVQALASGLRFDVHVEARDVDPSTVDRFVLRLEPNLSGTGGAQLCVTTPPAPLQDHFTGPKAASGPDGTLDTFPGLRGGQKVCFDVIPKMNTSVQGTDLPQLFRAQLQVLGVSGPVTVNLGTPREVFFLVPPAIVNTPIL